MPPVSGGGETVPEGVTAFWDAEALQRLTQGRRSLALNRLPTVVSHQAHLAETTRPAIGIAGNGMCSSGRIVNYLKAMLGDNHHNALFVGCQAAGILGGIQTSGPKGGYVELDGKLHDIRAGIPASAAISPMRTKKAW